MPIKSTNMR